MKGERVLLWLAAVSLSLLFLALARWQYTRGEQKSAWIAAWSAALAAEPEALADALASEVSLPRPIQGEASPLEPQVWYLLDNQRLDRAIGVRAYAVLQSANTALLADFGWLPLDAERRWPELPKLPDRIDARGMLMPVPGQRLRMAANDYRNAQDGALLISYLDPEEIGRAIGQPLLPAVLRIAPEAAFGFARQVVALPNTAPPSTHYGYAVQWLGLAIAVLATATILQRRSRR